MALVNGWLGGRLFRWGGSKVGAMSPKDNFRNEATEKPLFVPKTPQEQYKSIVWFQGKSHNNCY